MNIVLIQEPSGANGTSRRLTSSSPSTVLYLAFRVPFQTPDVNNAEVNCAGLGFQAVDGGLKCLSECFATIGNDNGHNGRSFRLTQT